MNSSLINLHRIWRVAPCAALIMLCACTPAREGLVQRYFWPIGLAQPRIEYLDFFQVEQDVRKGERSLLEEYVMGKERPQFVFQQPFGIVSDKGERVYVADIARSRIFIYDFKNKEVRLMRTMREGKEEAADFFGKVWNLDVDKQGNLYGVGNGPAEVLIFGSDEHLLQRFGKGVLENATGVAIDAARKRILVTDSKRHQLLSFSLSGDLLQAFGERGTAEGQFNYPTDIDLDTQGNIYVLDSQNARVQVFDANMRYLRSFGERGTALGSFMLAKSLAVSPAGYVFITDALAHRVVIFDGEGNYLLTFGGRHFVSDSVQPGGFYMPAGIDVDENDTIWIADSMNRMFHKFQYLNDAYLSRHPILPGQAATPTTTRTGDPGK